MDLIPHEELRPSSSFNFAPMIDFLFLMLCLFATLALSRTALYDHEIQLAESKRSNSTIQAPRELYQINLSVNAQGSYKWITEFQEHSMGSIQEIQQELLRQYQMGALSQDKTKTEILLHIDQKAPWKNISDLIFAIKELGFSAHPVYENRCR